MITITPDPTNPQRLILTQTAVMYLDKVLVETLKDELAQTIREQAKLDLSTRSVQKELRRLTTEFLAELLGIREPKVHEEPK